MGRSLAVAILLGMSAALGLRSPTLESPAEIRQVEEKKPAPAPESKTSAGGQRPIAGLTGFQSVSVLSYDDAPAVKHRLTATYVFPDRVRWFLGVDDEKSPERQMRYRFRERVFAIDARSTSSREQDGEERVLTLQTLELRRATMLWPDGFDWRLVGEEAFVDLGTLGSLRAQFEKPPSTLDEKDRAAGSPPVRVTLFDPKGDERESFRALTWKEIRNRKWPATAELWQGGKRVWHEHVESVETAIRFVDAFFLPADRRESPPAATPKAGQVQHMDLPSTCVLRCELKSAETWETALAEASRLHDQWKSKLEKSGLELDAKLTIEITAQALPKTCVLRLTVVPTAPPEGFETLGPHAAVGAIVPGLGDITPARLSTLDRAVPKGSKSLRAYVRLTRDQAQSGPILIVLPLAVDR